MEINEFFETFPILETDRLRLIQITSEHADSLFEIHSNENVMKFYDSFPHISMDETNQAIALFERRFKEKIGIRWAITLKEDNKLIGNIGYNSFKTKSNSSLGYALNENYWNNGILTEAVKVVTSFGFNSLKIHRIEAGITPGNIGSEKVLLKNNFTKEGTLREREFWKGEYQTIIFYSKLSTDI